MEQHPRKPDSRLYLAQAGIRARRLVTHCPSYAVEPTSSSTTKKAWFWLAGLTAVASASFIGKAQAQAQDTSHENAWQTCAALSDNTQRLACFDRWTATQDPTLAAITTPVPSPTAVVIPAVADPAATGLLASTYDCRDPRHSDVSRFWELEADTDCGTFRFRGYRPISASVVAGSNVNRQPSSPAEGHTATSPIDYKKTEMRIQLSVRTKVASNLLTQGHPTLRDSLWVGYTQQSYWQLFSPDISRPFRNTDHEPEVMYVYPTTAELPLGWKWRYTGLGLVHQSNGQSLPLSRSWNRVYAMTGIEMGSHWSAHAKVWKRLSESTSKDDNPRISDYVGRGEMQLVWTPDLRNSYSMTVRHSFGRSDRGSTRLEWQRSLGDNLPGMRSNLRLHAQLFSGYGDSLIDYNRRRTVFALGLSLVDF